MPKSFAIVFIILLGVIHCVALQEAAAQKQLGFDVKTPFSTKYELQIVKQGILLALNESPTTQVQEFGEDYSLWLIDVQRYLRKDTLYVAAQIEIRGPASLTRGDLIAQRTCYIQYHWDRANAYSQDHFNDGQLEPTRADYAQAAENIGTMMSLTGNPYGLPIGALSGAMVAGAIVGLGEVLSKTPTPVEVMESIYIGQSVLSTVEGVVRSSSTQ